jgi:exosortase/archaeosortase family protein
VRRADLFAGLGLVGLANGLFGPVAESITARGPLDALLATFGVSAIVWLAAGLALWGLRADLERPSRRDDLVAVAAAAGFCIPNPHASWAVLAALAVYVRRTSGDATARSAALTLLAVTVPMFWSKLLFLLFDRWILQVDAALVSLLTGLHQEGNALKLAGEGWGYLIIAGPCSAFANLSLLAPCWMAFQQGAAKQPPSRLWWVVVGLAGVIAINVARIALIGAYPERYGLLHGPTGAGVAAWLTAATIILSCHMGTRDDARAA